MNDFIGIVIPCYNEARRLQEESFLSYLKENPHINFVFVDDGSADGTRDILLRLTERDVEHFSLVALEKNCGKAEAVRQGVLAALQMGHNCVGFWDADLSTPLQEIGRFSKCLQKDPRRKVICGSRIKRMGANIDRRWYRHYPGRVIATAISSLLQLAIYDTQCGAKLFAGDIAVEIFKEPFLSPWLFDVELIARTMGCVKRDGIDKTIYELPLKSWSEIGESRIKPSYLPRIPYELMKIALHYRQQLYKD